MGTAAYRREGFKERTRVGGKRPIGAASLRQQGQGDQWWIKHDEIPTGRGVWVPEEGDLRMILHQYTDLAGFPPSPMAHAFRTSPFERNPPPEGTPRPAPRFSAKIAVLGARVSVTPRAGRGCCEGQVGITVTVEFGRAPEHFTFIFAFTLQRLRSTPRGADHCPLHLSPTAHRHDQTPQHTGTHPLPNANPGVARTEVGGSRCVRNQILAINCWRFAVNRQRLAVDRPKPLRDRVFSSPPITDGPGQQCTTWGQDFLGSRGRVRGCGYAGAGVRGGGGTRGRGYAAHLPSGIGDMHRAFAVLLNGRHQTHILGHNTRQHNAVRSGVVVPADNIDDRVLNGLWRGGEGRALKGDGPLDGPVWKWRRF